MTARLNRRRFLCRAAGTGAGFLILAHSESARTYAANDQLNVGLVGVGGRGTWFVDTIPKMENVVALCDVNQQKLDEAFGRWEKLSQRFEQSPNSWEQQAAVQYRRLLAHRPETHRDLRKMLDSMGDRLDAVVIATPDHSHAVLSAAAMRAGKHVFCEKPLTRTIAESRRLKQLAREYHVATSMGNQGTSGGQFRRSLELIRNGLLGGVQEVHIWNTGGGADRREPPQGDFAVPDYLDWDLWLGPAANRPYHPEWTRRHLWREFGTCQLGNWASHTANLAFMALKVDTLFDPEAGPARSIRVQAKCSGINRLSFPSWEQIEWKIPAREDLPPITFHWYNGSRTPGARETIIPLTKDDPASFALSENDKLEFAGAVFVGPEGRIHSTGHNMTFRLLPEAKFADVDRQRPQQLAASHGHERDWFIACRGGEPAWANFDYASALNQFLMLGNVATQFESELEFDPIAGRIVNNDEADALLSSDYRDGWSL